METFRNKFKQKKGDIYECKICDYSTSKKYNWEKHIDSTKHSKKIIVANGNTIISLGADTGIKQHLCNICSKCYFSRAGLWKHSSKHHSNNIATFFPENDTQIQSDVLRCSNMPFSLSVVTDINSSTTSLPSTSLLNTSLPIISATSFPEESNVLTNAIVSLIAQNAELQNMILEQNKMQIEQNKHNIEHNQQRLELTSQTLTDISKHISSELINAVKMGQLGTVNNTMTNINNTFNLQIFLNETCKDALNIDEFIENIKVTNADLEETARLGYSGGISRIFLNELNALDITKKPIHCSDAKRETIYIKDNNVWEKDDEDKSRLTKAVKQAARKNYMHIFEWEKDYPQCKKDPDSKVAKLYNKIICNSMSGSSGAEQIDNVNKIVKIIIRASIIDKQLALLR